MTIRDLMKKLLFVVALGSVATSGFAQGKKPAWRFEKGSDEHRLVMMLSKLARSAKDEVLPPLDGALKAARTARKALDVFMDSPRKDADRMKLVPVGENLKAMLDEMVPLLRMAGPFIESSVKRSQRLEAMRGDVSSEYLEEILVAVKAANAQALHEFRTDHKRLVELLYVICSLQEAIVNNAPMGLRKVALAEFGQDKYKELFS